MNAILPPRADQPKRDKNAEVDKAATQFAWHKSAKIESRYGYATCDLESIDERTPEAFEGFMAWVEHYLGPVWVKQQDVLLVAYSRDLYPREVAEP